MRQCNKLAIVIPAYKAKYLGMTLESINKQTDKRFHLYIGDDNSPEDLDHIVNGYMGKIPITYKKFDENLGREDLIAHWERCIDMVRDEQYIWFFSDDDMMSNNCVSSFYEVLDKTPDKDIYHFPVKIINSNSEVVTPKGYNKQYFPPFLSKEQYAMGRLFFKYNSFAIEYVFKKQTFIDKGGFVKFDLAWGSDDATWIRMSENDGIYSIESSFVYWRLSEVNISPQKSMEIIKRKLQASLNYLAFVKNHVYSNSVDIGIFNYWLHTMYNSSKYITLKSILVFNRQFCDAFKPSILQLAKLNLISYIFHFK